MKSVRSKWAASHCHSWWSWCSHTLGVSQGYDRTQFLPDVCFGFAGADTMFTMKVILWRFFCNLLTDVNCFWTLMEAGLPVRAGLLCLICCFFPSFMVVHMSEHLQSVLTNKLQFSYGGSWCKIHRHILGQAVTTKAGTDSDIEGFEEENWKGDRKAPSIRSIRKFASTGSPKYLQERQNCTNI